MKEICVPEKSYVRLPSCLVNVASPGCMNAISKETFLFFTDLEVINYNNACILLISLKHFTPLYSYREVKLP